MTTIRVLGSRLLGTLTARRRDAALGEEIATHVQLLTENFITRGMTVAEARAAALREFGGIIRTRESARDARGFHGLETTLQDLSYGWRMLRKSPGFSLVVALSLAVGIGASTATFSVVNAALLRPLPVQRPNELHVLAPRGEAPWSASVGRGTKLISYPLFQQLQHAAPEPSALIAMSRVASMPVSLTQGAARTRLGVHLVSGEFFHALGLNPLLGRELTARDVDAQTPVGVISHRLWQRRLAAAPDVIGRPIVINGTTITIVGVAPPSFHGVWLEQPTDIWLPLSLQAKVKYWQNFITHDADDQKPWIEQEGIEWLDLIARFTSAASRRTSEAAITTTIRADLTRRVQEQAADPELQDEIRQSDPRFESFARGASNMRLGLISPLLLLQAAVVLTLLISCTNAANMLLARGTARRGEVATRHALGATRGRLVRQLIIEGLLLVLIAVALGAMIAGWGRRTLASAFALPLPYVFDAPLDTRVLGFTLAITVVTTLLFALVPAWRLTTISIVDAIGRGGGSRSTSRLRPARVLVSLQVGLALVLVVGAGLLARTVQNLSTFDLGLDVTHLISVWIGPHKDRVPQERVEPLYRDLLNRLDAVAGVRRAAVGVFPLLGNQHMSSGIVIAGRDRSSGESFHVDMNFIGDSYVDAVGMHLIAGRGFDEWDRRTSPNVAIVNDSMARRYFGDSAHALGQRFGWETPDTEIVGVVADARVTAVRAEPTPTVYYPLSQNASYPGSLEIAAQGDPRALMSSIRRTIAAAAPELPIDGMNVLADRVDQSLNRDRFVAHWAASFSVVALGLAGFGVFGVMSFAVARRTREMAVRAALGARRLAILWVVFRESMALVAVGLLIGIPAAIVGARFTAGFLFGIAPNDPQTLLLAALTILTIGAVASLGPAWRAARVNPIQALRQD